MIIKMYHARKAGYCSEGLRRFAISHNIDWAAFLKDGIKSEDLAEIDDAQVKRLIQIAEKDRNG